MSDGSGERQLLLDTAGQFVLPFGCDKRVLAGHVQPGVTRDFRSLNGSAADLLAPGDVGPPEGVRSETRKIAAFSSRRMMKRRLVLREMRAVWLQRACQSVLQSRSTGNGRNSGELH